MLKDEDRIFKNLYNDLGWDIDSAIARGDWSQTKDHISKNPYELSENKLCSWTEVECLGACVNAPMMQINQDYFEDLDENKTEEIIQTLLKDKLPKSGSAKNRKNTAPEKGKTTLLEVKNA